jgi:hypothetical protein
MSTMKWPGWEMLSQWKEVYTDVEEEQITKI